MKAAGVEIRRGIGGAARRVVLALAALAVLLPLSAKAQYYYTGDLCVFDGVVLKTDAMAAGLGAPFEVVAAPKKIVKDRSKKYSLPQLPYLAVFTATVPMEGWAQRDGSDQWAIVDASLAYDDNCHGKPLSSYQRYEKGRLTGSTIYLSATNLVENVALPQFIEVAPCFTWLHYDLYLNANRPGSVDNTVRDGDNRDVAYTNSIVVAERVWSKSHYKLLGLSTNATDEAAMFHFGEPIAKADGVEPGKLLGARTEGTTNAVVVLYGVWRPRKVTVELDPDGGAVSPAAVYAVGDETCPALPEPVKTGSVFLGWYDGDTLVEEGRSFPGDDDATIVLKARWRAVPRHSVSFVYYSGDVLATNVVEVAEGASATPPDLSGTIPPTGYVFDKWSAACDDVRSDMIIDALYSPIAYTVAFAPNGGGGKMSAQTFLYDEAKALCECAFARDWHAFLGWSTNSADTAAVWADSAVVSNLAATAGARIVLYAIWECRLGELALAAGADFDLAAQGRQNIMSQWTPESKYAGCWAVDETERAVKVSDVAMNRLSRLTGVVKGPGTLSFSWKATVDIERYDWNASAPGIEFTYLAPGAAEETTIADGPLQDGWTTVAVEIPDGGETTVNWVASRYKAVQTDSSISEFSVWIRDVRWQPLRDAGGFHLIFK